MCLCLKFCPKRVKKTGGGGGGRGGGGGGCCFHRPKHVRDRPLNKVHRKQNICF